LSFSTAEKRAITFNGDCSFFCLVSGKF